MTFSKYSRKLLFDSKIYNIIEDRKSYEVSLPNLQPKKKRKKKSYGKFTISLELLEWLDAKKPIYPNFKERQ